MDPENNEIKRIRLEGYPGWRTIPDMFEWFDNDNENVFVYSEQMNLPHWPEPTTFHAMGMPSDMQLVELVASGGVRDRKLRDYLSCFIGVIADRQNPTKGQTNSLHTWHFPNNKKAIIHHWGMLLIARDVETKLIALWNANPPQYFPPLPQTEPFNPGWWHFF